MPSPLPPLLLIALAAPAAAGDAAVDEARLTQLIIRERIVIRVPRVAPVGRMALPTPPKPVTWRETKGPKCIPARGMAGMMISAPKQVDLMLIGGKRVRARLNGDCKPLDFYNGFYLRPDGDGMICAARDSIRMRSGASCGIDAFKTLVAK